MVSKFISRVIFHDGGTQLIQPIGTMLLGAARQVLPGEHLNNARVVPGFRQVGDHALPDALRLVAPAHDTDVIDKNPTDSATPLGRQTPSILYHR